MDWSAVTAVLAVIVSLVGLGLSIRERKARATLAEAKVGLTEAEERAIEGRIRDELIDRLNQELERRDQQVQALQERVETLSKALKHAEDRIGELEAELSAAEARADELARENRRLRQHAPNQTPAED